MAEAPYKLSRAAQRERYGARSIDARSRQSDRDTTPSGKMARFEQAGMNPQEAAKAYDQEFRAQFQPVSQTNQSPQLFSRRAMQAPQFGPGLPPPAPMNPIVGQQTLFGPDQLPPPKPLGLIPPAGPISDMGEFMPTSVGPLTSFALPKPTVLSSGSRWSRPSFG